MSAPLPPSARLVLERGVSHLRMRAAAGLGALCEVSRTGTKAANVRIEGNEATIRFPLDWPWQSSLSEIVLAAEPTWEIEVRGGLSKVRCELEGLGLTSLSIIGGASDVELALGRPSGTCPVRLAGGASHLVVTRPKEVAVRLSIRGGASHVALDDSFFGAVGGKLRMESNHGAATAERYDIEIAGGVSHLRIS